MGGNLVALWRRARHGPRLVAPPAGQGQGATQPNATTGNPPISGPGKPVPPIGGSTTHPTPSPLQPAGGGKHSPRGGHFYFALPPDISIPV